MEDDSNAFPLQSTRSIQCGYCCVCVQQHLSCGHDARSQATKQQCHTGLKHVHYERGYITLPQAMLDFCRISVLCQIIISFWNLRVFVGVFVCPPCPPRRQVVMNHVRANLLLKGALCTVRVWAHTHSHARGPVAGLYPAVMSHHGHHLVFHMRSMTDTD